MCPSFVIDWYKTVKRHFQDNWGKQQRLGMILKNYFVTCENSIVVMFFKVYYRDILNCLGMV